MRRFQLPLFIVATLIFGGAAVLVSLLSMPSVWLVRTFVWGLFLVIDGYLLWPLVMRAPAKGAPMPTEAESPPRDWLSPFVWQHRRDLERYTPELGVPSGACDATLEDVSTAERDAAPVSSAGVAAVPASALDAGQAALRETPSVLAGWNPLSWPRCCDRVSVLMLVNPFRDELAKWSRDAGVSSAALASTPVWREALAAIDAGEPHEVGSHVFQCSGCGRCYVRVTHS